MFVLKKYLFYYIFDTYWPNEYVAPATHTMLTFTNATSQRRESLRLDHYIAIVAPRLKLGRATIQKDDVLRACVGCIKAPLRLRDFGHQLVPDILKKLKNAREKPLPLTIYNNF